MYSIPTQCGNTTYNPPSDTDDNSGCGCGLRNDNNRIMYPWSLRTSLYWTRD